MDIKELNNTRYMVVNPWSDCNFNKYNEIITSIETINWIEKYCNKLDNVSLTLPTKKMFLKLKWWQARKLCDLPKYIKTLTFVGCNRHNNINGDAYIVYEVKEYMPSGFIDISEKMHYFDTEDYHPSTKEEYEKYKIGHENYGLWWDDWFKNKYKE